MQRKLMEGFGQFAMLEDAEGAGYLGLEEGTAIQRARVNFGAYCEGIAAIYLHRHESVSSAKRALRKDFNQIEVDAGKLSEEEAALSGRFTKLIDETIERLANISSLQRLMILWMFRTPGVVKGLIFVIAFTAIAILLGKVFGK